MWEMFLDWIRVSKIHIQPINKTWPDDFALPFDLSLSYPILIYLLFGTAAKWTPILDRPLVTLFLHMWESGRERILDQLCMIFTTEMSPNERSCRFLTLGLTCFEKCWTSLMKWTVIGKHLQIIAKAQQNELRVGQLKEPTNEPVSGRGSREERNSLERKIVATTTTA